ncbi:MAG: dihydroorotate dehydrogenase (fumarate) [Bacteroidetes bacterium]|nr:MAG: dihydroorotate dehydrogenase (fumarate) [Bacteroidota bacterium]
MNLSTTYLGLPLNNPVVVSSSKLTGTLENVKACANAGAGAVVLKSLFEEQITARIDSKLRKNEMYFWYPEASEYIQGISKGVGAEDYLKLIVESKKSIKIPVIASINCVSPLEWPKFASKIQDAGADALELNIAIFPFSKDLSSQQIEDTYVQILTEVKKQITIPVAVKLGPFFTNMMNLSFRLADAGADGLVLFNRFYNPDVDIATAKVVTDNVYSSPDEKSVSMRWIALLSANRINADLAASTGIHYSIGVAKQLLAGATVAQVCTTLYQNGIPYLHELVNGLSDWMKKKGYKEIADFRGMVNKFPENTAGFERLQYMKKNFE